MTVAAEKSFEPLPIERIVASRTNPRRHFDDASQAELAASIAEHDLQQPLLVRPLFDSTGQSDGMYEIVIGERRYRAMKALGKETVPCMVREMTDQEAREIQIVENLQRADVSPLEEAEAFQGMLEVRGTIAAVAARVGKQESYVAKCLRLNALTLPSRDALRGRLIAMDHALLLARLAETEQNAALKWALDRNAGSKTPVEEVVQERTAIRVKESAEKEPGKRYFHFAWEPASPARLKAWIEAESGILLSRAPWPLTEEDYLLPDVGPCSECPKNTRANVPLFGDLEMGEATCTDGACFAAKTEGFVQIELRELPIGLVAPRLSWKSSSVKPSIVPIETGKNLGNQANPAKVLKQGQWVEAKPGSCDKVQRGVTVDWSDAGDRGYMGDGKKLRKPGELLTICIAVGCKAHPKAWEKAAASPRQQQERHDPAAEKKAQADRDHVEKVEHQIRSKILHAILSKLDSTKAIALVAANRRAAAEWRKRLLDALPELDGPTLEAFVIFCSEFQGYVRANGYWLMQPGGVAKDRKEIFELAKKCGVDAAQVAAKYFHDEGSIAPASYRLYPKGVPWPKAAKKAAAKKVAKKAAAKKVAKKAAAKKAAAPVKKGQKSKPARISPEAKKHIADAMKKRFSYARKAAAKKVDA